jgi:hypothetical protein
VGDVKVIPRLHGKRGWRSENFTGGRRVRVRRLERWQRRSGEGKGAVRRTKYEGKPLFMGGARGKPSASIHMPVVGIN